MTGASGSLYMQILLQELLDQTGLAIYFINHEDWLEALINILESSS